MYREEGKEETEINDIEKEIAVEVLKIINKEPKGLTVTWEATIQVTCGIQNQK